ncbi:hypothetical protein [Parapedobacter defluvii]|uniref:hypothetical protein n=1 Tax=Parapedobacter defluvii TaxID=2045106 RepID=UPI001664AFBE|nr:hypothetical protein [Parapedobacter defluvii]
MDNNLEDLVERLGEKSLILSDFEKSVYLFTGEDLEVEKLVSNECDAFRQSLDALADRMYKDQVDYLLDRDFSLDNGKNSDKLLQFYSKESVRISTIRQLHQDALKNIDGLAILEGFYDKAVRHFTRAVQAKTNDSLQLLNNRLLSSRPDSITKDAAKTQNRRQSAQQIVPEEFDDLFYPAYKKNVNRLIRILEFHKAEDTNPWQGHRGWARIFYDYLIKKKVIYDYKIVNQNKFVQKQDASIMFARRFYGLGDNILTAKVSITRISDSDITKFKSAIDNEVDKVNGEK